MVGTPKNPPARHKTFGISDSLLDAARKVQEDARKVQEDIEVTRDPNHKHIKKMGYKVHHDHGLNSTDPRHKENHPKPDVTLHYQRGDDEPSAYTVHKNRAAYGDPKMHKPVKPKTKVGGVQNEDATADFKKKHSTTVTRGPRKIGGMSSVDIDIKGLTPDQFEKKYGKKKTDFTDSEIIKKSKTGQANESRQLKEMHITVQMNAGGTSYKVLSVSKDMAGRIKPGENLTDTHIDDLRDMDVSISYKKDSGGTGKMGGKSGQESVDMDSKNAKVAIKHDCATHVVHKEHGEGQCIPGQHTLVEKVCPTCKGKGMVMGKKGKEPCPDCGGQHEGYVTHYDVMFESGIHEDVPVKDLEIVKEMSHGHAKKKSVKSGYMMSSKNKMKKPINSAHCNSYEPEGDQIQEAEDLNAKNVEVMLRHDCASHVRHGEWGEGRCVPGEHTLIETAEGEGIVTHYDVMFEHGLEEEVDIIDLEILSEESHNHMAAGKMKKGKKVIMDKKKKKDDEDDNGDDNLDPVNPNALKGTHDDRKDGDIDNDGDEDDSDEYLHKKRKAISKAMKGKKGIKEWINFAQKRPGDGTIKNAMEANNLAQHYLQMAQRDKIFGRDASENEKLAKQFYEQYKEMQSAGDESDDDTFQNEKVVDALENIKEDVEKTQVGAPHKIAPQYNTKTHKLVKRKGQKGLKTVPKDYKLQDGEYEAEEVEPQKDSTKLDEHAPEVVEYTPSQYDYNRNSWMSAMNEVNRYKGRSGIRVTKPDKEGPEHIIMQLRKVITMGDKHGGVEFGDGSKSKVKPETAKKALEKYARMKPAEKEKWQKTASHSRSGLSHATSDKPIDHKAPGQDKPRAARRGFDPLGDLQHPDDK